jgi:hypothetical protein
MKCTNLLIQKPVLRKKEIERNDRLLNHKLMTMKSNLSKQAPYSYSNIYSQAKKEYREMDRHHKICTENRILLTKLNRIAFRDTNHIMGKHGFDFDARCMTLNAPGRKARQQQIQSDNLQLLQRLKTQKPSFRIRSTAETQTNKSGTYSKFFQTQTKGFSSRNASMGATGTNWKTQSRTCERMTAGNACHSPTFFHRKKKSPSRSPPKSHNSKSHITIHTKNPNYAYHNDYEDDFKHPKSMNTTNHGTKGKFHPALRPPRNVRSSSEAQGHARGRPYQKTGSDACVLYNGGMNIGGVFYKVFIEENSEQEIFEITYTNHKTGQREIFKKYDPQIWADIVENHNGNFEDLIKGVHDIEQKNQKRGSEQVSCRVKSGRTGISSGQEF